MRVISISLSIVVGFSLLTGMVPVYSDPGDIIVIRNVPPQRFSAPRQLGKATVVNPSPVRETERINNFFINQQSGLKELTELTDQQSSGITSNLGSSLTTITATTLNTDLASQASSTNANSALGGHMGSITGMTSGLGRSVGGSVNDATRSTGDAIRSALSDSLFGK